MEDFEEDYRDALEAGQRNLKATHLLSNWCYHAEFVRSSGRGMIEAQTGLPIGHMGVRCKFSKKNSMHTWLLEDAAYDFYVNNCKGCSERVPVGIPNIMDFISPREEAASIRRGEREAEKRRLKDEKAQRQEKRAILRDGLRLEETFVLDLLDDLDQEDIDRNDPRLEELANLAPETFTQQIIEHLLPAVLHEYLPYSMPAAKALLRTPLEPTEKLAVAVSLVGSYEKPSDAIKVILDTADLLSGDALIRVLDCFTSMALGPPPGMHFGDGETVQLNAFPVKSLYSKKSDDIQKLVNQLIGDEDSSKICSAVETILAVENKELLRNHIQTIFAKLMRRRTLLPDERRDSSILYYLRETATQCIKQFPIVADNTIQAFLADEDETGKSEAFRAYRSVLDHGYREVPEIGEAQRIAFRRLLWAAVENPDGQLDEATQFFRHSWDEFAPLAVENFDELIGAAANLSAKYEAVDKDTPLEHVNVALTQMERNNRRTSIDSLQGALIEWAAAGARSIGRDGVLGFLSLYQSLPENQTQMRGNMISHVSKLLTGVESLTWVLSDWYRALMDEDVLVRASAIQAWENVPYDLVQHFPDLFFEALAISLSDPYVFVHERAVFSLRHSSIPKEKCYLIRGSLWNLIMYYAQEDKRNDFTVDCIDAFSSLCLSKEQLQGELGQLIMDILFDLEGSALYHAVDRLGYRFRMVPGFARVAIKALRDDYTRGISIEKCAIVLFQAPLNELGAATNELKLAFEALKPYQPEDFPEALLLATALSRGGADNFGAELFRQLLSEIPKEKRHELWRIETALVATALDVERRINAGEETLELESVWSSQLADLEKEHDERAKL